MKCQVYCGTGMLVTMWQGDAIVSRPWSRLQCHVALLRARAQDPVTPLQGLWFPASSENFISNHYRLILWLLLKMLPGKHGFLCTREHTCRHACTAHVHNGDVWAGAQGLWQHWPCSCVDTGSGLASGLALCI